MTVGELAQALVTKRGSVQDEPHRTGTPLAVARAAIETERDAAEPRFQERRIGRDRVGRGERGSRRLRGKSRPSGGRLGCNRSSGRAVARCCRIAGD